MKALLPAWGPPSSTKPKAHFTAKAALSLTFPFPYCFINLVHLSPLMNQQWYIINQSLLDFLPGSRHICLFRFLCAFWVSFPGVLMTGFWRLVCSLNVDLSWCFSQLKLKRWVLGRPCGAIPSWGLTTDDDLGHLALGNIHQVSTLPPSSHLTPGGSMVRNLPPTQETRIHLCRKKTLEKEMATHSSILAWAWGASVYEVARVRHNLATA